MSIHHGINRFPPYRISKEILTSPLLGREIRVFLRSKKAFIALFCFLTALVIVVSQNWAYFASHWNPGEDIAKGARSLFFALSRGHLLFLMLVTPFLMAPLIAEEREKETLPLILSSPVSITHFILAKGFIPVIYVILFFTAAVPVLALCFLGGGLSAGDLIRTYLILLTATLTYGSLGLFCSTLRPKVYEVYLLAVIMIILYGFVIPFHGSIWHFLNRMSWEGISSYNHGLQILSPYYMLENEIVISPGSSSSKNMISFPNPLILLSEQAPPNLRLNFFQVLHLFLSLFVCFLFLALSVWRVRVIALGDRVRHKPHEEEQKEEKKKEPQYERTSTITFEKTTTEGNPGYVLERRVQWFAKWSVLLRLFYISLMISILSLPLSSYEGSWLFFSIPFMAAAFFTLPLAATSFSAERERGTLDLLRTSLLSTQQIVKAKFYTSLQYSFLIALALFTPGMLLQMICGWVFQLEVDLVTGLVDTVAISCYPLVLFCSLIVYTSWSLYCSARFHPTNQALIISGIIIFLTLVTPFILPEAGIEHNTDWGLFGLSFVSPLTGVSVVFPEGSINMPSLSVMVKKILHSFEVFTYFPSAYDPSDPHSARPIYLAPYIFGLLQCLICLFLSFFLLKKTVITLENND